MWRHIWCDSKCWELNQLGPTHRSRTRNIPWKMCDDLKWLRVDLWGFFHYRLIFSCNADNMSRNRINYMYLLRDTMPVKFYHSIELWRHLWRLQFDSFASHSRGDTWEYSVSRDVVVFAGAEWHVVPGRGHVWHVGGVRRHVQYGFHPQPGSHQRRQVSATSLKWPTGSVTSFDAL